MYRNCQILLSHLCSHTLKEQVPFQVMWERSYWQDHLVMPSNRQESAMKNTSDPSVCLSPQNASCPD